MLFRSETARSAFERSTATVVMPSPDHPPPAAEIPPTDEPAQKAKTHRGRTQNQGARTASDDAEVAPSPALAGKTPVESDPGAATSAEEASDSADESAGDDLNAGPRRRRFHPSRLFGLAVAGVLILALVAIVFLGRRLDQTAEPSPGTEPAQSLTSVPDDSGDRPTTAGALDGSILVDALPWGELRRIVDQEGAETALPTQTITPLALTLPAGFYRITLVHPGRPEGSICEVELLPGQAATCRVVLIPTSPEAYFRETGWWR